VKYFLNTLLTAKYNVLMTPASFNTPMGVVRTIREQLRPTHEIFICEMGARRNGEIQELCDIAEPDFGILTSVGPQHLETFRTIETIIDTKFALARSVAKKGRGVCFVNADNTYIREHMDLSAGQIPYGTTDDCNYFASDLTVSHEGTRFVMHIKDGGTIEGMQTSLVGMHNAVNLAGAIGMALYLGVTPQQIRVSLAKLTAPPHRLELKRNGAVTILDDAYNANPSGSKAALDALAMFPDCKILVTPGMVELGAEQEQRNEEFGRQAAAVCDYIFLVGERQAVPIRRGIEAAGFDMSRVTVTHTVEEAISGAYAVQHAGRKVILLENDLPDNYL
jgi:UDP-N-acetylmuramoyl-tripeptide--D-alanyl-D-alanine ligase